MSYTASQLISAYTAVNDGVAPDASTTATLNIFANMSQSGAMSDSQVLSFVINSADNTTAVAVQSYQFFIGKSPTKAGLDFLVNSPTNPTDLNDPYYTKFNIENRYLNFAANLGVNGEGAAAFSAAYGAMSFSAFINAVYESIIGSSYATAAGVNVSSAVADITSRQQAFKDTATSAGLINANSAAAQIDIATKAAAVGYLIVEGIKADVGRYAAGSNNFALALINGGAQYNVDLTAVYSPMGGGTGSAYTVRTLAISDSDTLVSDKSYSVAGYNAASDVGVASGRTLTFTDAPSGFAVTIKGALNTLTGTTFVTGTAGVVTGTADVLNLSLSHANIAANNATVLVTATGFETINVATSPGTQDDATATNAINLNLNDVDVKNVSAGGVRSLGFTATAGMTKLASIDFSGLSGAGAAISSPNYTALIDVSAAPSATASLLAVKGSTQNDLFTVKDLVTVTGNGGNDTFVVNTPTDRLSHASITDANAGDRLGFAVAPSTFATAKVNLASTAAFKDYLDLAASGSTAGKLSWFQFGGDTFAVQDNGAGTTFTAGTDAVVRLVGTHDLTASTLVGSYLVLSA